MQRSWRVQGGFTLVELVTVIVLLGVLAAVAGRNIGRPVVGFVDAVERAELVDAAEAALHRMTRELRLALPNSVRCIPATCVNATQVEFLRTVTGGRYRAALSSPTGTENILDFSVNDSSFDVLGPLVNFGPIAVNGGAVSEADCRDGLTDCLVIFNTGVLGANAYTLDNVAAITAIAGSQVQFVRSSRFPFPSPGQRFQVVDTPVRFVCQLGINEVRRFSGYRFNPSVNTMPANPRVRVVANRVTGCRFNYDPGNSSRAGLVTISLTLQGENLVSNSTETVTLLQQVNVPNIP